MPYRRHHVYDFDDDWQHRVQFEQLLVVEPAPRLARCVDGAQHDHPRMAAAPTATPSFSRVWQIVTSLSTPTTHVRSAASSIRVLMLQVGVAHGRLGQRQIFASNKPL